MLFSHAKLGANFKSADLVRPATDAGFERFYLAGDLKHIQSVDADTSTLDLVARQLRSCQSQAIGLHPDPVLTGEHCDKEFL